MSGDSFNFICSVGLVSMLAGALKMKCYVAHYLRITMISLLDNRYAIFRGLQRSETNCRSGQRLLYTRWSRYTAEIQVVFSLHGHHS